MPGWRRCFRGCWIPLVPATCLNCSNRSHGFPVDSSSVSFDPVHPQLARRAQISSFLDREIGEICTALRLIELWCLAFTLPVVLPPVVGLPLLPPPHQLDVNNGTMLLPSECGSEDVAGATSCSPLYPLTPLQDYLSIDCRVLHRSPRLELKTHYLSGYLGEALSHGQKKKKRGEGGISYLPLWLWGCASCFGAFGAAPFG